MVSLCVKGPLRRGEAWEVTGGPVWLLAGGREEVAGGLFIAQGMDGGKAA